MAIISLTKTQKGSKFPNLNYILGGGMKAKDLFLCQLKLSIHGG